MDQSNLTSSPNTGGRAKDNEQQSKTKRTQNKVMVELDESAQEPLNSGKDSFYNKSSHESQSI